MNPLPSQVTEAEKTAARTRLRALMQEYLPALDISTGGVVDSLLVDALSTVDVGLQVNQTLLALAANLRAIADGTVTATDDAVDALMQNYRVTRTVASAAACTLEIVVQFDTTYTVFSTTEFLANGIVYKPTGTLTVVPTTDNSTDLTRPGFVKLTSLYDSATGFQYRFRVNVVAATTGSAGILVAGDTLQMVTPFAGLGSVTAVTNATGGTDQETSAALVLRALDGLTPLSLSSPAAIAAAAARTYTRAAVAVVGAGDSLMTRDSRNVLGLSVGGCVDVYAKSGAVATTSYIVNAVVVNQGTRQLRITLTREQSAGVYDIKIVPVYAAAPPSGMTGELTVTSTTYAAAAGLTGFVPKTTTSLERAGSAVTQIEVVFNDTRTVGVTPVVTLPANGGVVANGYRVEVLYQPGILELDAAFRAADLRTPGTDLLVRAAPVARVTVAVACTRPTGYAGRSGAELGASLTSLINALPVGKTELTSFDIGNMVRTLEPSLTVSAVAIQGTVLAYNGLSAALVQTGSGVTVPTITTSLVSPSNTYFAATRSAVQVTLV